MKNLIDDKIHFNINDENFFEGKIDSQYGTSLFFLEVYIDNIQLINALNFLLLLAK